MSDGEADGETDEQGRRERLPLREHLWEGGAETDKQGRRERQPLREHLWEGDAETDKQGRRERQPLRECLCEGGELDGLVIAALQTPAFNYVNRMI